MTLNTINLALCRANKFWSAGSWYRPLVCGKTCPPKRSKFVVQYSSMLILSVSENCLLESECFKKKISRVYPFTKQDICIYIGHFAIHLISLILVFFSTAKCGACTAYPSGARVHPFSRVHVGRSLAFCVCFVDNFFVLYFLPFYCLFFIDWRLLITLLVSLNFSCLQRWDVKYFNSITPVYHTYQRQKIGCKSHWKNKITKDKETKEKRWGDSVW